MGLYTHCCVYKYANMLWAWYTSIVRCSESPVVIQTEMKYARATRHWMIVFWMFTKPPDPNNYEINGPRSCAVMQIFPFKLTTKHGTKSLFTQRKFGLWEFFEKPHGLLKNQRGFERFTRLMMVYDKSNWIFWKPLLVFKLCLNWKWFIRNQNWFFGRSGRLVCNHNVL